MEKIYLWRTDSIKTASDRPSITPMLLDDGKKHPAILVIPGGGYGCVCSNTEGFPIAEKFNQLGYHAFVLDYRTAPERWPAPMLDAMRAMKIIRANAERWNVIPDQVASCGFSAGGHLAGALGILGDKLDASDGDAADAFPHRPDCMILCYGVLVFAEWSHCGTQRNLLGENYAAVRDDYSLDRHISANTPPAFLMHTICDKTVDFRSSTEFAQAMAAAQRPCELALYYWGDHGMLLGKNTLDVVNWPKQAHEFMQSLLLAESDKDFREHYTNRYQTAQN